MKWVVTRTASATGGRTGSLLSRELKLGFSDGALDCFKSEKELCPETIAMEAGNVKFGKNEATLLLFAGFLLVEEPNVLFEKVPLNQDGYVIRTSCSC